QPETHATHRYKSNILICHAPQLPRAADSSAPNAHFPEFGSRPDIPGFRVGCCCIQHALDESRVQLAGLTIVERTKWVQTRLYAYGRDPTQKYRGFA
ncbi:MAG TPA: hypothetical protein VNW26_02795, partial [Steroidobacteraceae bacterium]|nr:hypothetical protein [Steroidobacteraceae bacterium]